MQLSRNANPAVLFFFSPGLVETCLCELVALERESWARFVYRVKEWECVRSF